MSLFSYLLLKVLIWSDLVIDLSNEDDQMFKEFSEYFANLCSKFLEMVLEFFDMMRSFVF